MGKVGSLLHRVFWACDEHDITNYLIGGVLSNALLALAAVAAVIEYIWRPISCHAPATFTDAMEQYAEAYCRNDQTYFLPLEDYHLPTEETGNVAGREARRLHYEVWFPILLLVHALLLRLPQLTWRVLSKWSTVNLTSLIKTADAYPTLDASGRQAAVKTAADYLHANFTLRDPDDGRTKLATVKDYWQCVKHPFPIGILSMAAVLSKLMYAVITTIMFVRLCHFLGVQNASSFGWIKLHDLYVRREMDEIAVFPDVVLCDYEVRLLGNIHRHTIQCVLPLNRFFSIAAIVLWFLYYFAEALSWITFIHSLFSTLLPWPRKWFIVRHLHHRRNIVATVENLYVQQPGLSAGFPVIRHPSGIPGPMSGSLGLPNGLSPVELRQFLENHLRMDGYFVLKYVSERGNDLFVYELVNYLWRRFSNVGHSAPSVYDRSVEQSPAIRHRILVDQGATVTPPSTEMSRKLVPASVPSIPGAVQQAPSTPLLRSGHREGSVHGVGGDESKRPLLTGRSEDKGYWESVESTKM